MTCIFEKPLCITKVWEEVFKPLLSPFFKKRGAKNVSFKKRESSTKAPFSKKGREKRCFFSIKEKNA
jgi:hypothetical protein